MFSVFTNLLGKPIFLGPCRKDCVINVRLGVFSPPQESLQLHRPDFISRSGERIKRLKLIVQERKLQNVLQSEREALFNTVQEWQGCRNPMHQLPKRGASCPLAFLLVGRRGKVCFIQGSTAQYQASYMLRKGLFAF